MSETPGVERRSGRGLPPREKKHRSGLYAPRTRLLFLVEATSQARGAASKLCRVSLISFYFRLPVTRSVGLKGQGGPGVSETRGGARDVIVRRHEASPRVTERPSATLRLRHPGAPAPDKKDPHQLFFLVLFSLRVVVGGKVFVWRPACGRQRRLLWAGPLFGADRSPYCSATFPGISPVVCDMAQWRNWRCHDSGKRPVAHPGRCLPPRVKETPF